MTVRRFGTDLPRAVRGGGDVWDKGAAGVILAAEAFPTVSTPTSQLRRWSGTAWVPETLQRRGSSSWQPAVLQRWNGTAWVVA